VRKTIFIKGLSVIFCLLTFFAHSLYAQCYGPTSTGNYTNGKQPSASSNYFVNHVFSTFTNTSSGEVNGNIIALSTTGSPGTNDITSSLTPGETLVTGTEFPSTNPFMHRVSPSNTSVKVTHTFTSALDAGTHVFLQDVDRQEGWSIVFKDASGTVIDPGSFTPFNVSTTDLPATYTATTTNLSFKSGSNVNRSEPLVGIIITSSLVKSIEFSVTTVSSSSSNTEFFYSVPLTPSFTATATSNSAVCSGYSLILTGGTSSLASTVPTPVSFIWSGPNSYSSTTTSTTAGISSVTTAAAGTYSLQAQDAFGCFTSSAITTAVTINSSPSLSLSSNSPVNYSNTINLSSTITGGVVPYAIAWSGPNSFSSAVQSPVISSVSSANAGVYTLQVSGSNGCSASATTYIAVKSGWIYIHDKNINEESSVDFTFNLKDTTGNILKTFFTNDSAGNTLNVYDIGAGHDDGAGTLWVIAGTNTGTSNTGTVYNRQPGSTTWSSTSVTTATAIDGAGLNKFVYANSSGDAYFYNAGTSTLIFNHSTSHNGQTANASDIAYGGGKIALRNANGRVYLYAGDYTNDSWTDISGNTNIADRIDMSSDGSEIVYILSATVKTYTISTATTTTLPAFTTTSGAGASNTVDVAIDDNGNIYATGTTGNTTCCGNTEIVFSYASGATSWTSEPEARGVTRLTGGPGGQAWGSIYIGSTFPQTIYTRVTDNTGIHLWLDDERMKNSSSLYDNSIMMEVDASTYDVTVTLPDTTWDVGRFNIYDPTGNTTGDATNKTATIDIAYGEVVHVEFINEKLRIKVIDNANCSTNILQSFDAGTDVGQFGNSTYGTALEGTSYHYFTQTSPQDGYYYLLKSIDGYWFSTPGVTDHTGNNGYFLMVNASYAKDEFYRQRITGLTENLTYRIQFYVGNVSVSSPIKPKIRFGMQTLSGTIFGDSTTPEISGSTWQLYSVSFTVPSGITTADLFLRNENIGGLGNDLVIDDIAINPIPTPLVTNVIHPATLNLCVGSSYIITNTVSGGTWSTSDPSAVTIDSATGSITVNSVGTADITYTYVNNIYCVSTAISNVTLSVPPAVTVSASSDDVCKNGITTLYANPSSGTAPYSYLWSGSNGTISSVTTPNPTLTAPSTAGSYDYSVEVTDSAGCASAATTTTVIVHAPTSNMYIFCEPDAPSPYARLLEMNNSPGFSWLWTATSNDALFYSDSLFDNGSTTSTLQSPYINYASQYKVVVTDDYGCKDSSSMLYDYSVCTVLTVSLMDFIATRNNERVLLNWKTSSETNSKYFFIERSLDEKTWTEIGYVSASGNSNTIKNYLFTDILPSPGTNYYRLKQVDMDGKFSFSGTRKVSVVSNWKLKVYPNPVAGGALQIKSNTKIAGIRIIDINGKILFNSTSTASTDAHRINVSGFAPGFYFMEVINNKNEAYYTRFIKN
jgi:hypothetical protein